MNLNELKETPIWLNWNKEQNEKGNWTKVPVAFDGSKVGTTGNYTNKWCDYKTAKVQLDDFSADGVGFVLNKLTLDDGSKLALATIDIDHRAFDDIVVQDTVSLMNTYTEKSPSGEGLHLIFLVDTTKLPEDYKEHYYMKNPHLNIECYVAGFTNRFMTFTGDVVNNTDINERTTQLIQFLNTYMSRNYDYSKVSEDNSSETTDNTASLEDNPIPKNNLTVLDTISKTNTSGKFEKLFYDGDTSDYNNDDSAADMALATIIAFYVGPDFKRIDNLMKQSKLYRTKWERQDYKEMTIKKAIENCNNNYFNWNNEEVQKNNVGVHINSFTAEELMKLKLDPLTPVVENMLYPGLSVLAGAPKVGKSWFCLDLCTSIANGSPFLGFKTNKSECYYLALEDSERRLQSRLELMKKEVTSGFHLSTSCTALDEGLLSGLQDKINEYPDIKLVIIDTFQKIRGAQVRGETWYASDYKEMAKLKRFADINKISVLLIHHLRKQKDSDVFNQISGSTGITGAADTMIVLNKMENENGEVMMSITGRDVDSTEMILKFNKSTYKWEIATQMSNYENYRQQLTYQKNPIVITIKALLAEHPDGFSMTATELLKAIHSLTGIMPKQNKPQTLTREINENLQFQLWDFDKIYYEPSNPNGGSAGRKLYFSMNTNKM